MKLQVCIVGCGDMGRLHARAWQAREDAQVISVCDLLEDRRGLLADEMGATPYGAYAEAVRHPGVNVVSVCTPANYHAEIACYAAEQGCHVLCEKPLALTLEQADRMIATAKANGVLLSTSFQYRGMTRFAKYKALVEADALGRPFFAHFRDIRPVRPKLAMHLRSGNGGPVIDMAGHYIDMMRFLTGSDPVSAYAQGHVFGRSQPQLAELDDLAIDAAAVTVTMASGDILTMYLDWGKPEGFDTIWDELLIGPRSSVHNANGRIESDDANLVVRWAGLAPDPTGSTVRVQGLAEAIQGRAPLEVTGEDGRWALATSLAALQAIDTGQTVPIVVG